MVVIDGEHAQKKINMQFQKYSGQQMHGQWFWRSGGAGGVILRAASVVGVLESVEQDGVEGSIVSRLA